MRDRSTRRALSPHGERHTGLNEERMAPGSAEHAAPGCVRRGTPGGAASPPLPTGRWVPGPAGAVGGYLSCPDVTR